MSNELWLTFENVNVKPIFTPKKSSTAVTLFPSHLSSPLPLMLGRSVRESKKKKKKKEKTRGRSHEEALSVAQRLIYSEVVKPVIVHKRSGAPFDLVYET